jgi:PAS domain-containing protein
VAERLPVVTEQAELAVLDHIPDPVILLGAQREVIFANRAAVELLQELPQPRPRAILPSSGGA